MKSFPGAGHRGWVSAAAPHIHNETVSPILHIESLGERFASTTIPPSRAQWLALSTFAIYCIPDSTQMTAICTRGEG